jgi:hypothetical protein
MIILAAMATATSVLARPTDFGEISLWVRARETDQSIVREVTQRKLAHALTPQQEASLKAQGASDSLVRSLRNPSVIAAPNDAAAPESKPPPAEAGPMHRHEAMPESSGSNVHIVDVSLGHAVNLSSWGGPDCEVAINVFRFAGEDVIEPAIIDPVRTYTDVATYTGPLTTSISSQPYFHSDRLTPYLGGDLKDDTYMIGNYTTVVSHSVSRPLSIDWGNPVSFRGVPYLMYPIYEGGGVSLFYVGRVGDSVRLAVYAGQ